MQIVDIKQAVEHASINVSLKRFRNLIDEDSVLTGHEEMGVEQLQHLAKYYRVHFYILVDVFRPEVFLAAPHCWDILGPIPVPGIIRNFRTKRMQCFRKFPRCDKQQPAFSEERRRRGVGVAPVLSGIGEKFFKAENWVK